MLVALTLTCAASLSVAGPPAVTPTPAPAVENAPQRLDRSKLEREREEREREERERAERKRAASENELTPLGKQLKEVLAGKVPLAGVYVTAGALAEPKPREVEISGTGVATWDGRKQFHLSRRKVLAILKMLDEENFCSMPEAKGEEANAEPEKVRVKRGLSLTIGDETKRMIEVEEEGTGGEEAEDGELTALIKRVLDACEKAGEAGLGATDLADGLAKLRDGKLEPDALRVSINCPQQPGGEEGFSLLIAGTRVEAARSTREGGWTPARTGVLTPAELSGLVRLLIDRGFAALPLNVYGKGYTDLGVRVLNQHRNVQARTFAAMKPDAASAAQQSVVAIRSYLQSIFERVEAAGGRS